MRRLPSTAESALTADGLREYPAGLPEQIDAHRDPSTSFALDDPHPTENRR